MGLSMGMIGALGGMGNGTGVGGALMAQGDFMRKQEEADLEMGRRTKLERFLLEAREEFAIKAEGRADTREVAREGRADTRTIATEDRAWKNEQDRAPTRAKIAAVGATVKAEGELGFKEKNKDRIVATTQADTDAKVSTDEKAVKKAHADYYSAAAAGDNKARKLDPADAATLKHLEDMIEKGDSAWTAGVLNGSIIKGQDGILGTPEQREVKKRVDMNRQQRADLIDRVSVGGGGGGRADPLGRSAPPPEAKPDGKLPDGKPYKMKSGRKAEPIPQAGMVGDFDINDPALQASIDDIKDPKERANARIALTDQKAPMGGGGPKSIVPPAPGKSKSADASAPDVDAEIAALDPGKTRAVDQELETASSERRAPKFSPELQPHADRIQEIRARYIAGNARTAKDRAAKAETERREREQRTRDEYRPRVNRSN